MEKRYTRKQAADLLGISAETLRHYEKIGLIREPERTFELGK